MAKIVHCPHCFENFDAGSLLFRCLNPRCRLEDDELLARHLGLNMRVTNRFITPTNSEIQLGKAVCQPADGGCGEPTTSHLCLRCHSEIPQYPWQNPNFICSVVGSNFSGKSCFIAVLMHQVFKEFVGSMGEDNSLDFSTEEARELFRKNYIGPILERGETPEVTRGIATNPDVRRPLIYTLSTWRYLKYLHPIKKRMKTNLVIYDTPGEDFSQQRSAHALKSISRSDALVFVVDFTTFEGVAQSLGLERVSDQSPADVMQTFYNVYVLQNPRIKMGEKIQVPTAVVLSKVDLIQKHLQNSMVLQDVSHQGGIDLDNLQRTSTEVEGVITRFGGKSLNDALHARFENFMYFGVSSGREVNQRFHAYPHRIMDPLIWLMHEQNLIPAK